MPRVTTTLTVTTNTEFDRERIIHRLAKTIRKITQGVDGWPSDVNVSMSSYTDENPQVDMDALADWEKELIAETAVVMPPAKEETPEPGFPHTVEPDASDIKAIAKNLVYELVNDWAATAKISPESNFVATASTVTASGWVVIVKHVIEPTYIYEVTRDIPQEETAVKQFKYDRMGTFCG